MTGFSEKWDRRFLDLCETVARWSKDPSTKVGAVIVRPDLTIASAGYNGFPRSVADDPEVYARREDKYARVVHAELNAILHAHESVAGYTLYSSPLMPCSSCAGAIIQSGISRVVYPRQKVTRWTAQHDVTRAMFRDARIFHHAIDVEQTQ